MSQPKPNLITRAAMKLPFIGGYITRAVQNRYEAAIQWFGDRSFLLQTLQDARFDIDTMTRMELQRKHRYFVSNNQLVTKIRSLFIQFAVGPTGLRCIPNSSDEKWNESRNVSFESWAESPDVGSRLCLQEITIQWAGCLFDDGEFFVLKTQDAKGKPAIQTIEAHRCVTPPTMKDYRGFAFVDGIAVDENGKPQFYCFKTNAVGTDIPTQDEYKFYRASEVIHKFKHRRVGQIRGIPEGYSCMNTLHDFDDLQKLEMQCAKIASEIATVETNPAGELDTSLNRRSRLNMTTQNSAGQGIVKQGYADYNVVLGGKKIALKTGDSLKNFMVDRPTTVQQQYWDLLITQICCGYNVPKLLVTPASLQGTVTRADLDVSGNAFRVNFEIIACVLREIYQWQGVWANDFDLSQDGSTPDDHSNVIIRAPRSPNVDVGYTARNLEIELNLGVKTLQDVYAEKQQNWREQLTQIAETQAYVKMLAKKFDIDPAQITALAAEPKESDLVSAGEAEPKEVAA